MASVLESRRILVPVSGSPCDQEALEAAALVAKRTGARVLALYVIRVSRSLPLDAEIPPDTELGEFVLERAEKIAQKAGAKIETDLLQSREVGSAIVDEAIERSVDLIVIAVLNERKFGQFDLGPTATYVLENAPCRVWLCRSAGGDGGDKGP